MPGRPASVAKRVDELDVYLASHYLNKPSQLYAYLLWAILLSALLLTKIPVSTRWTKALSNWTRWRILRHRAAPWWFQEKSGSHPPEFLPTNGNILRLSVFFAVLCCLYTVGPDYIHGSSFNFAVDLPSHKTISKSLWTSAARSGLIAFSLFPLCILLALKSSPPAVLSWSFTIQLSFDKLALFHQWTARFIYLFTSIHVVLWTAKLCTDRTSDGSLVIRHAFEKDRFVCGCLAFGIFTILMATSASPLRRHHYEAFYALHILLFPLMLIMCAFHHPETGWWAWLALSLWVVERVWRCGRIFLVNCGQQGMLRKTGDQSLPKDQKGLRYQPPPGYAHAELLCGATVRLTYTPRHRVQWAPGQHFLINTPFISNLTSHPFTCCSIFHQGSAVMDQYQMVFLIRAKKGWTKDLWDAVSSHTTQGQIYVPEEDPPSDAPLPSSGLVMKMNIDGPFGSSVRVPWERYSGALIIVGGSGVTFGLAILEHLSGVLSSRQKRWHDLDDHVNLQRIRFVWLVRDFGHIQWCASVIRRCKLLLPEDKLQIDVYVTESERRRNIDGPMTAFLSEPLKIERSLSRSLPESNGRVSVGSLPSEEGYATSRRGRRTGFYRTGNGLTESSSFRSQDLTEFEGELDIILPGEIQLSDRIKREGRVRRARTRKARGSQAVVARLERTQSPLRGSNISSEGLDEGPAMDSETGRPLSAESSQPLIEHVDRASQLTVLEHSYIVEASLNDVVEDTEESNSEWHSTHHRHGSGSRESWLPLHCALPRPPQAFSYRDSDAEKPATPIQLSLDERELKDIAYVAEHAKPEKPKLSRILQFELEGASESLVVTCCGPVSLNVLVRENIAARMLEESKKRNGGKSIVYYSEEFEY